MPLRPFLLRNRVLSAFVLIEAVNYLISFISMPRRRPVRNFGTGLDYWRKCVAEKTIDVREMLLGWFYVSSGGNSLRAVELDELQRGNIEEFLAFCLYTRPLETLSPDELSMVDEQVAAMEARIAEDANEPTFTFPSGYNSAVKSMRHNLDKPNIQRRSLVYYFITDVLFQRVFTPFLLRRIGFTPHWAHSKQSSAPRRAALSYWYHPGLRAGTEDEAPAQQKTPLVFVHGVGFGLLPYTGWVRKLLHNADGAPLLLVACPFGAQKLTRQHSMPTTEEETAHNVGLALRRHGHHRATFIGHSLGTIYLSWLVKHRPQLVASSVFIDPVCFLLHVPGVARGFLYPGISPPPAAPTTSGELPNGEMTISDADEDEVANGGGSTTEEEKHAERLAELGRVVEEFFIMAEPTTATFFRNHFSWHKCMLWPEALTTPSAVLMADQDQFVPVDAVRKRLLEPEDTAMKSSGLRRVRTFDVSHGQFMFNGEARRETLRTVRDAMAWARG